MARPTLDELKKARDGTTQPLLVRKGDAPGAEAYRRHLETTLERLRAKADTAEEEAVELERHAADQPEPPRDPMLLRPLGGQMYAVIAHWELTELERSVIAGRRF